MSDSVASYKLETSPNGRAAAGTDNGDLFDPITVETPPAANVNPATGYDFGPNTYYPGPIPTPGLFVRLTATLTSGISLPFDVEKAIGSVAVSGALLWTKAAFGMISSASVHVYGVKADALGNVYAVGDFAGTVDFGLGSVNSHAGGLDIFIAKYDSTGALVWVKTLGSTGDDSAYGITIDTAGNIIVTGGYHGAIDFGGTTLTNTNQYYDCFVVKYNSAGTLLWAKSFGGTFDDIGAAITVDSLDNVLLAVRFQSQPGHFGGTDLSALGTSGGYDVAIVKMASLTGNTTWAKRWGGTSDDLPTGIACDSTGNVYVCGQFWGVTDVGGGNRTSSGGADMFIAKYSGTDGTHVWSRTMGGLNNDNMNGIAIDPLTGNVIVTGGYVGVIDFGGGAVTSGSAGTATTMFLAGYDSSGNFLWVKTYGGDIKGSGDSGHAIAIDSLGTLALTGYFTSWMDFNRDGLQDADGSGYFVYEFGLTGNNPPVARWGSRAAANGIGNAVCYDSLGHLVVGGSWQAGTLRIGSTTVGATAGTGGFVAQYSK